MFPEGTFPQNNHCSKSEPLLQTTHGAEFITLELMQFQLEGALSINSSQVLRLLLNLELPLMAWSMLSGELVGVINLAPQLLQTSKYGCVHGRWHGH